MYCLSMCMRVRVQVQRVYVYIFFYRYISLTQNSLLHQSPFVVSNLLRCDVFVERRIGKVAACNICGNVIAARERIHNVLR